MRISTSLAAAVLCMTGLVTAAPAATAAPPKPAAGGCSLAIPSKVAIVSPYREVTARLAANCAAAGTTMAAWEYVHPSRGPQQTLAFFEETTTRWALWDFDLLGRWTWRPAGAFDDEFNQIVQNTTYTDVKVGSWASLTATRAGQRVTLSTSVARYSSSNQRYIPWAGATGQLQYRIKGQATWRALAGVRANSSGKYTYSRNWGAALEYRVYFPATPYIWNVATPTVYR